MWDSLCPLMERFVRQVNSRPGLSAGSPMPALGVDPKRRAFVSEASFFTLREFGVPPRTLVEADWQRVADWTEARLASLDRRTVVSPAVLGGHERIEVIHMGKAIAAHCNRLGGTIRLDPPFGGCGIVDACVGDLLVGDCLMEVKSGDRNFRGVDFRQCLVYLALNHANGHYPISRISVFNPRVAVAVTLPCEDFTRAVSTQAPTELYERIAFALAADESSL